MKRYLSCITDRVDMHEIAGYAEETKDRACSLLAYMAEKMREFSVLDFAIFKICLMSLGVWLGAQCARFFKKFKFVIFLGFIASYIYLVWRIFFRDCDCD